MKKIVMLVLSLIVSFALVSCSVYSKGVAEIGNQKQDSLVKTVSVADEIVLVAGVSEIFSDSEPEFSPESSMPIVEEVEAVEKISNEEVAAAVLKGEYGNGPERITKIESLGYDYSEIQKIVNKLTPKATVSTSDPGTSSVSTSVYKANAVYIKKTAMPFKVSNYANQGADIDGTSRTWVTTGSYPDWNPDDNKGTFFAQHNNRGGDVIMKLNYGDVITVTDWSGKPYKYVVDKIIRNNMATEFDAELSGDLDKEYLIFQTCEYGDGNIHVFASRQYE